MYTDSESPLKILKDAIVQGNIESILDALKKGLIDIGEKTNRELLLILSNLIEVRRNLLMGIIPYSEYQINYSKFTYSILLLLDGLEEELSSNPKHSAVNSGEKEKLRRLLILFQRAVFRASFVGENAVKMLGAFRSTRILLQMEGATLIENVSVAQAFQDIINELQRIEFEVAIRFPDVESALRNLENDKFRELPNNLDAVFFMYEKRHFITHLVDDIEVFYRSI